MPSVSQLVSCELCSVVFPNNSLDCHVVGKKHLRKLKLQQEAASNRSLSLGDIPFPTASTPLPTANTANIPVPTANTANTPLPTADTSLPTANTSLPPADNDRPLPHSCATCFFVGLTAQELKIHQRSGKHVKMMKRQATEVEALAQLINMPKAALSEYRHCRPCRLVFSKQQLFHEHANSGNKHEKQTRRVERYDSLVQEGQTIPAKVSSSKQPSRTKSVPANPAKPAKVPARKQPDSSSPKSIPATVPAKAPARKRRDRSNPQPSSSSPQPVHSTVPPPPPPPPDAVDADPDTIDFGIVDSRDTVLSVERVVMVGNPSDSSTMTLTPVSSTDRHASPFSVSVTEPVEIPPLSEIEVNVKFNKQGLTPGRYVDKVVFDFHDGSPMGSTTLTMKATLGHRKILEALKPTAPYVRPNRHRGKDVFEDLPVEFGVNPLASAAMSYKVRLGWHKTPKYLYELFDLPLNDQLAASPFNTLQLTTEKYGMYFSHMIHAEEHQTNKDIQLYDLHGVTLRKTKGGAGFILAVSGLSENRPSIVYGDSVYLISPEGESAAKWEGHAVEIRDNEVVLRFNDKFKRIWRADRKWDVRFSFNRTTLRRLHDAVARIDKESRVAYDWKQRMFPVCPDDEDESQKEEKKELVRSLSEGLELANKKIATNPEQRRAVAMVLSGVHGLVPFLVFGPPGTGKTSTVIECMYQLLHHPSQKGKPIRILATAPSNASADLILKRLSKHFDTNDMIRINAPSRASPLIDDTLMGYCHSDSQFGRPVWTVPAVENLFSYKIIVTTCGAAGTLFGIGGASLNFTHVFVDEAGQALEPEVLLALQVLIGHPEGRVILSGDPRQLGPIVRSPLALRFGYNISLLERLIMTAADVPNGRGCYSVADDAEEFSDLYGTLLQINYRSHPSILEVPNSLFYRSRLIPAGPHDITHSLVDLPCLPTKKFPMIFQQMNGQDLKEANSPSWFNPLEVTAVIDLVMQLLALQVRPEDIGVIAPYRKQVAKIRQALASVAGARDFVTVGTAEAFQGAERRVIIVSTVRASQGAIESDKKNALGFVGDAKRFNVAMTRARALLCVIGDARVLAQDRYWREWMEFVAGNGGWVGDRINFESQLANTDTTADWVWGATEDADWGQPQGPENADLPWKERE